MARSQPPQTFSHRGEELEIFIAVGSNIEPMDNITRALTELLRSIKIVDASTFYLTKPIGRPEQPSYANGAFRGFTTLTPRQLKFDVLRPIEAMLGRRRSADRYASRPIDLDIAILGDLVVREPDLSIPDPDIRSRSFVAVPLLELAPDLILPDKGELLSSLDIVAERSELEPMSELTRLLKNQLVARKGAPL